MVGQVRDVKPRVDHLEMLWWLLFTNGGVVLAVFVPVHILLQGILAPLGVPVVTDHYSSFVSALGNPVVRLYLFVLIAAPMYHWAHRYRVIVGHLGFRWGKQYHPWAFYGLAILGTLVTAYVLITAP